MMTDEWDEEYVWIENGVEKRAYCRDIEIEPWWNDAGQQLVHTAMEWKDGILPPEHVLFPYCKEIEFVINGIMCIGTMIMLGVLMTHIWGQIVDLWTR